MQASTTGQGTGAAGRVRASGARRHDAGVRCREPGGLCRPVIAFASAAILASAPAAGEAPAWRLDEVRPGALEAVVTYQGPQDSVLSLDAASVPAGVLDYAARTPRGARVLVVVPVLRRDAARAALGLSAYNGDPPARFDVVIEPSPRTRGFALPSTAATPVGAVRKRIRGLRRGMDGTLLGGVAEHPDDVSRKGHASWPDAQALTASVPQIEAVSAFLPAAANLGGRVVLAWGGEGDAGVWAARQDGRTVRVASRGKHPQLAALSDRLVCVWSREGDIVMAASRDGGATWDAGRVAARAPEHACLTVSGRGRRLALCWQSPEGIAWRVLDVADGSAESGAIEGNAFAPYAALSASGVLYVAYLRRGPRGNEAVYVARGTGADAGPFTLIDSRDVVRVAIGEHGGTLHAACVVRVGDVLRLAHAAREGFVHLLPATGAPPLSLDLASWGDVLCISYAAVSGGRLDLFASTTRDDGFTWEGPLRLVSGRALCVLRGDVLVRWEGATEGGAVFINGTQVFHVPAGCPTGQVRAPVPAGIAAPHGWIRDTVRYDGDGTVDVTVILHTPAAEHLRYGLTEAHAASLPGSVRLPGGPDVALLCDGVPARLTRGRPGGILRLDVAVANVGDIPAAGGALVASLDGREVLRKATPGLDVGEERYLTVHVPLPARLQTAQLVCAVVTAGDLDAVNDALSFPVTIMAEETPVLRPGGTLRLAEAGGQAVVIETEAPSFVRASSGGKAAKGLAAVLVGGDARRDVSLAEPLHLGPGAWTLILQSFPGGGEIELAVVSKTDAFEPNDTVEQAPRLQPGVELALSLTPAGDQDWFIFTLPSDGHLVLDLKTAPSPPLEPVVSLRAPDGAWYGRQVALPCTRFLRRGSHGVLVTERFGREVRQEFVLRADLHPARDDKEPNDTPAEAHGLVLGQATALILEPAGDVDWFACVVPGDGYLRVDATAGNADGVVVGLHDAAGEALGKAAVIPVVLRVRAGTALLRFEAPPGAVREALLRVAFVAEFDVFEPNDQRADARPLAVPGAHHVVLWPSGDRDWFRIEAPEPGILTLGIPEGCPPGVVPAVSLWAGGEVLATLRPLPAMLRVPGGEVLVELRDAGQGASPVPFVFTTGFEVDDDAGEGDDAHGRALAPGAPARFILWPPDDADTFLVRVATRSVLRFFVEGGTPGFPLEFELPDGRVVFGRGAVVSVPAGEARVRIRAGAALETKAPFTLHVRIEALHDPGEPNDTPEEAQPLEPGAWRELSLYPDGDVDHFAFRIEAAGTYVVETRAMPPTARLCCDVLRAGGGGRVARCAPGEPFRLEPGGYVLAVRDLSEPARADLFELRVRRAAD